MSDYTEMDRILDDISNTLRILQKRGNMTGVECAPESKETMMRWGSKEDRMQPIGGNAPTTPTNKKKEASGVLLENIREELGDCKRCDLCKERTNIVFGEGNPNATLLFLGEGPGRDEDEKGRPFVGRAGQLLDKIVEAMGFSRKDVYICNVVKCRPPNNRNPEETEIAACFGFAKAQIASIQPKAIVTLGKISSQVLLSTTTPISKLRGQFQEYEKIPVMPTYHPAYLLRNPSAKREVWEDMKQVMVVLKKAPK